MAHIYSRIDLAVLETAVEWDLIQDPEIIDTNLLWVDELIIGASNFNFTEYVDNLNI